MLVFYGLTTGVVLKKSNSGAQVASSCLPTQCLLESLKDVKDDSLHLGYGSGVESVSVLSASTASRSAPYVAL